MSNTFLVSAALGVPMLDLEALTQGRTIVAMPKAFRCAPYFLLCPVKLPDLQAYVRRSYRPDFLLTTRFQQVAVDNQMPPITAWAKFEDCKIYSKAEELRALSLLSAWTADGLQSIVNERQRIFIASLRVFQLTQPIETKATWVSPDKAGRFIQLPTSFTVDDALPVLDDQKFARQYQRLEKLAPPPHRELEKLDVAIATCSQPNFASEVLRYETRTLLGWNSRRPAAPADSNLDWIHKISSLGNRTLEEDEGISNYQAGTNFEIAVRDSLQYLGFKIELAHKGGAGGLDLACSKPYTLIGECKSGKKIPNDTAVQLLNLGTLRLPDKETYRTAAKLIIGPGEPTSQLEKAAKVHGMAIINPTTLENLVQLHHQHPGSIDLFQLKEYLADGRADDEIDKYIQKVRTELKLRADIVSQLRHYLEDAKADDANVDSLHAVYVVSKRTPSLSRQEFHEILIELSSPLAGYLGRRKDTDGKDRFYFLRELQI
jgi:hypothetical protein